MPRPPFTIPLDQGPVSAWADRAAALSVFGVATAIAVVIARVAPDGRGFGTHEQFGMSPCSWPLLYGMPCPTCGCTTAACLLVHGRLLDAVIVQPFGALAAIAGVALGLHALLCLLRRRSFVDLLVRLPVRRILVGAVVCLLLAWWYKCLVFAV